MSLSAITLAGNGTECHQLSSSQMSRWQPDAAGRLMKAAITLFVEQGYEETTVAEIAERAGLTKRTFFRYFSDKREVLFSGSQELQHLWLEGLCAGPAGAEPARGRDSRTRSGRGDVHRAPPFRPDPLSGHRGQPRAAGA